RCTTKDRKRTMADLKKRRVKTAVDRESETCGRFTDPDGNVVFLAQPAKPKVRRAGVSLLGFVTVASRDSKKTGEFFRKALGMRKQRAESDEEDFDSYQLSPKATAITPFTPRKDMYDNPADYDADMAHIGGCTCGKGGIGSGGGVGGRADIGIAGGRGSSLRFRYSTHPTKARATARNATMASRIWIIPRRSLAFGETARTVTVKRDVAEFPAASVTVRLAA